MSGAWKSAKGYMDALGIHNYGGNTAPDRDPSDCGICFRRAEMYRQLMVKNGDAGTPIWATEFGWLMDSGSDMGQYDWMKVSPQQSRAAKRMGGLWAREVRFATSAR